MTLQRFSENGFKRRTTLDSSLWGAAVPLIPHSSLELPEPPESLVSQLRSPSPLPPSLSIVFERLRSSPQLSVLLPTWWVFCQLQLLCGWTAKHDSWGLRRPCGGTPRGPRDVDMAVKFSFNHIRHRLMHRPPCRWKLRRRSLQMLIQVHAQSPSPAPAVEKPFTDRAARCQALKWI